MGEGNNESGTETGNTDDSGLSDDDEEYYDPDLIFKPQYQYKTNTAVWAGVLYDNTVPSTMLEIKDSNGEPIKLASVYLKKDNYEEKFSLLGVSDNEGILEASLIPQEIYNFKVEKSGYETIYLTQTANSSNENTEVVPIQLSILKKTSANASTSKLQTNGQTEITNLVPTSQSNPVEFLTMAVKTVADDMVDSFWNIKTVEGSHSGKKDSLSKKNKQIADSIYYEEYTFEKAKAYLTVFWISAVGFVVMLFALCRRLFASQK